VDEPVPLGCSHGMNRPAEHWFFGLPHMALSKALSRHVETPPREKPTLPLPRALR